jgi:hypothetical protein
MTATAPRVEIADLVRRQRLGRGGQGIVTRVTVRQAPHTPVAYKEYLPRVRPAVQWPVLERLVSLYRNADEATRAWFDEHTAWPTAIVTEGGQPRGYLMQLAPSAGALSGPDGQSVPLAFEFLLNPPQYLRLVGLRFGNRYRLGVLRSLAEILDRLHAHGFTVGDLSPKNVLVGAPPDVRCFLLDCDSLLWNGASAVPPVETPDWVAPPALLLRPADADVHKLALFAVRLTAGDQSTRELSALRAVFPTLVDVTDRSLTTYATNRPDAHEWIAELDRALGDARHRVVVAATPPPSTTEVRPDRWWGWPWVAAAVAASALMAFLTGVFHHAGS